jgi:ABC-type transporter Mla MlaB component
VHLDLLKTPNVKPSFTEAASCLLLVVEGDLKSTTIDEMRRDIGFILKHDYVFLLKIAVVELDISSAITVDSVGLNLVLSVLKWATNSSVEARVIVGMRSVYEMMLAIGLDKHAQIIYRG